MLDTTLLLCVSVYVCVCVRVYPKIRPGITGIVESHTKDAYKFKYAQIMPFGFRYLAILSAHGVFCSVGRIKKIFHKLKSCMMH
jgi:hypothetical protein